MEVGKQRGERLAVVIALRGARSKAGWRRGAHSDGESMLTTALPNKWSCRRPSPPKFDDSSPPLPLEPLAP